MMIVSAEALYADVELPARILKNTKIRMGGLELELRGGTSIDLPLKVLAPLRSEGVADIDPSRLYSLQELNKMRWVEERSQELQGIEESFYLKAGLTLRWIEEQARSSDDPALLTRARRTRAVIVDILRRRMYKIARLAVTNPLPSKAHMKNMTREERLLYANLCHLLESWHSQMISMLEGGLPCLRRSRR